MAKLAFMVASGFIFYAYFGYPLSIFLLSVIRAKRVKKDVISPFVTIIIAVYNAQLTCSFTYLMPEVYYVRKNVKIRQIK